MSQPFLRAVWANLGIVTYAVAPDRLASHLPPGLVPDTRDGQAFVSLVAFDFREIRVGGVAWPGYRRFPEINLRGYVREGDRRGVLFLREFVPRRLVAGIARWRYNEPYRAAPMEMGGTETADTVTITHRLVWGDRPHGLRLTGRKPAIRPSPESDAHFFKEHQWGFGTDRRGRLLRYEVRHPVWDAYPVQDCALDWDWARVYGPEWRFLQDARPCSTVLAVGSPVEVFPPRPGG